MINIVIINGGRGASTIIPEILNHSEFKLTSIVNAYDDGKSTGQIRDFFNMLGPSDIRKVQELMLPDNPQNQSIKQLFSFRFSKNITRAEAIESIDDVIKKNHFSFLSSNINSKNITDFISTSLSAFLEYLELAEKVKGKVFDFSDCSIMNCIYAGAYQLNDRNLEKVAQEIEKIFLLRGSVLPTNIEDKYLVGIRENGEVLYSEAQIVELRSSVRIKKIYLLDRPLQDKCLDHLENNERERFLELNASYVDTTQLVQSAFRLADIIIYSSGTQHSSLYPTYMTKGVSDIIINNSKAKKFFITNIGEDYETPSYQASDFIFGALKYLNYSSTKEYSFSDFFDYILINQSRNNNKHYIPFDKDNFKEISLPILHQSFEDDENSGKHCGKKVLDTIKEIYYV